MGKTLIQQVSQSTGLPDQLIQDELVMMLNKAGIEPDNATLDDLRRVLAEYMQEILVAAKDELAG